MDETESEALRQAAEQQILFLGNLIDALVQQGSLNHAVARGLVGSVHDLVEHPALKERWGAVKRHLE